ncbi:serine/threonine protein kinase [Rhodopirellula sp. SWK7]|uniref:serine/threonine protein kinase n=1 Tax=Rhodopirellula sp. SWK7 TaxID=595460 RepID=UPI0002BD73E9|nr:protein kinase [Rhodopirellula sp. SWK7]EMI46116.1 Serine/threonine protein kinase-related protein [Rhodopirellula sp. SWK7]
MSQDSSLNQSRVSRLRSATGSVLTQSLLSPKRMWIGPALTAIVIAVVGWMAHRSVEDSVKTNVAEQLQALLSADLATLEFWFEERRVDARSMARMKRVSESVAELAEIGKESTPEEVSAALLTSDAMGELRERMRPLLESGRIEGFVVIDQSGMVIGRDQNTAVGDTSLVERFQPVLAPVFAGKTVIIPPFPSVLPQVDRDGSMRAGVPTMAVASPVESDNGEPIAALCLTLNPAKEFTKILRVARYGKSGETYAFNAAGVMITGSRFDDELKKIGLLADDEQTRSVLNVRIRDPGVDLTRGNRPTLRGPEQPLTRMAADAISGGEGVDVDGYRDYRGVRVVGAWQWLPRENIGIATEVDAAEAFRPLYALRRAFGVLAGLLGLTTIGLAGLALYASRLELRARQSALEAKRLGQYALGEKLGAGGMGVVYRAHHDMLHRPTAVKLLHVDKTNEQAIARFEREVQLTSQLTHPNTIAIYDYGRTPEGIFYYAMEYLNGISLHELVERFGPLPDQRVNHILCQLCGSLSEAHDLGLIHRDIKPANIMLTKCGGMCDFVKLLDFGLVKSQNADRNVTLAGSLTGTPLYMSPEAIQQEELDARSDLYAVGAVGYFLLTGTPVFEGKSIVDICKQHLEETPQRPSERLGKPLDDRLEEFILCCLSKRPDDRPANAESCEEELLGCQSASRWTQGQAKAWWAEHLAVDSNETDTEVDSHNVTATIDVTMDAQIANE